MADGDELAAGLVDFKNGGAAVNSKPAGLAALERRHIRLEDAPFHPDPIQVDHPPLEEDRWELYDLAADPAETTDLADTHPDVQALRRQIASLQQQPPPATAASSSEDIAPSLANLAALDVTSRLLGERIESLKARRANQQAKHDDVSQTFEALNQLIVRVPEVQVNLGNLERRHENMRARLEELSAKLDDAKLGERLELDKQAERFEVIEQPITPTEPTKPNRPLILAGGLGLAGAAALATALLEAVGEVAWIDDESLMDAVTAVSGSGPAYIFHFIECLTAAAESAGLPTETAKLLAMLPKAAETYRRQIAQGLDKDPRAAGKARVILRKLLNGTVRLIPDQGGLWAEYQLQPAALLKGVGTGGSGGRI